jgi:hypothetical protein
VNSIKQNELAESNGGKWKSSLIRCLMK